MHVCTHTHTHTGVVDFLAGPVLYKQFIDGEYPLWGNIICEIEGER